MRSFSIYTNTTKGLSKNRTWVGLQAQISVCPCLSSPQTDTSTVWYWPTHLTGKVANNYPRYRNLMQTDSMYMQSYSCNLALVLKILKVHTKAICTGIHRENCWDLLYQCLLVSNLARLTIFITLWPRRVQTEYLLLYTLLSVPSFTLLSLMVHCGCSSKLSYQICAQKL